MIRESASHRSSTPCALLSWMLVAAVILSVITPAVAQDDPVATARSSVDRGLKWLRAQQAEDGSWSSHTGVTALAITAFCRSHRDYDESDGPFIRKGIEFLLAHVREDGSITAGDLPAYNTAVALMALKANGNPDHEAVMAKAQAFLGSVQADEGEGYRPEDKYYGGIGYGNDERPDLSNLQLALEAMAETGVGEDDPVWDKAVVFLQRCQNYSETNDQAWAGEDGGFVYLPDPEHSALGTRSYGSMTYAGLKSFLYAGLDREDPRVQAAIRWSRENYTLEENPGMGSQGLFYYYHTFSKAMATWGEAQFADADGTAHDWYAELVAQLSSLQSEDGFWINENDRWWERDPNLVTAFAVLALEAGYGGN